MFYEEPQFTCALFEGDYDGQVHFVPEDTLCGLGTRIRIQIDKTGACSKTPATFQCCLDVLVDCFGLGHDDDLIPFLVSCPKITANGRRGAIAFECPSTVNTVDVWKIDGTQLVVLGRLHSKDQEQFVFIFGTRRTE
ncbi:hypothetical protein ACA910_005163 [Epithemia clementina (nom. ined.)]